MSDNENVHEQDSEANEKYEILDLSSQKDVLGLSENPVDIDDFEKDEEVKVGEITSEIEDNRDERDEVEEKLLIEVPFSDFGRAHDELALIVIAEEELEDDLEKEDEDAEGDENLPPSSVEISESIVADHFDGEEQDTEKYSYEVDCIPDMNQTRFRVDCRNFIKIPIKKIITVETF